MSKFVPRQTYEEKPDAAVARAEVNKAVSNGKPWPGEAELKVRIDHPSTDGSVSELAARIAATGAPAMSRAEREAARDAGLAFLASEGVKPTPAVVELINRLVGLEPWTATQDPQVTSAPLGKSEMGDFMADLRRKIAMLKEQVEKLVGPQSSSGHPTAKPARFVTKATGTNEEIANTELRKALANGTPMFRR
jgi:hypothetical protein